MVDETEVGNRIQMVVDRMEMTSVRQLNYILEYMEYTHIWQH